MSSTTLVDEIQELNLAYLLLSQRLLAEDRASAMLRLKIDDEQAEVLANLNARQLTRLSRTNQLICHLGIGNAQQLHQITDNPREQGLAHLHSSLLMATSRAPTDARGG